MPIADEEKYKRVRYSIINAGIGATAKVVHDAVKIKSWAGSSCYASVYIYWITSLLLS